MSLEKFIGSKNYNEILTSWQASSNKNINVTLIGSYNNGKSSLGNSILDDYKNSTFRVSDNRETRINQEVQRGNITYIDTPGLNAKSEDNEKVYEAIKKSDLNIIVHNITTGELTRAEVDFLLYLRTKYEDSKDFLASCIFALTKSDEMQNEENIRRTEEKIQEQIKGFFGNKAKILTLSSTTYLKGKKEDKKLLVKKSNIENLKAEIANFANNFENIKKLRRKKLNKVIENFEAALKKQLRENKEFLKEAQKETEARKVRLEQEISNIEANLINKYNQLNNI